MDANLTNNDFWSGALFAGILSAILVIPLLLIFRSENFTRAAWSVGLSSAIFWGVLATAAIIGFWELYYRYLYPAWVRPLVPLDALLYAAIGLVMWWLASRLPGPAVVWFVLLGGFESILEHLFGIYILRILEKVPMMVGVSPLPALVFAFFEYIVYWALVAWLALGLFKIGGLLRGG